MTLANLCLGALLTIATADRAAGAPQEIFQATLAVERLEDERDVGDGWIYLLVLQCDPARSCEVTTVTLNSCLLTPPGTIAPAALFTKVERFPMTSVKRTGGRLELVSDLPGMIYKRFTFDFAPPTETDGVRYFGQVVGFDGVGHTTLISEPTKLVAFRYRPLQGIDAHGNVYVPTRCNAYMLPGLPKK